jgi:pyrimidine operon attenuation protein/uracil phosphoribosyltransferase
MPVVMDADRITRTLTRIAHEILERSRGGDDLALVGIQRRGVPLARRLAAIIKRVHEHDGIAIGPGASGEIPTGALDITLYRDDFRLHTVGNQPQVGRTEIPFSIDDKRILLVDDVLYTGRTIRAALDELADFGRPARIALAVLIDRGGRELPIQPDVVGKKVEVPSGSRIDVLVSELDGRDAVIQAAREAAA